MKRWFIITDEGVTYARDHMDGNIADLFYFDNTLMI
jgi:hypothetical protein